MTDRSLDIMEFPLGNSTTFEKGTRCVWSSLFISPGNLARMLDFTR
jgi:hypothetical protein